MLSSAVKMGITEGLMDNMRTNTAIIKRLLKLPFTPRVRTQIEDRAKRGCKLHYLLGVHIMTPIRSISSETPNPNPAKEGTCSGVEENGVTRHTIQNIIK